MAEPKGITTYSNKIAGEKRNYDLPVRFDLTDGFLGITQFEGDVVKDRALLSPKQVRELVDFIGSQ